MVRNDVTNYLCKLSKAYGKIDGVALVEIIAAGCDDYFRILVQAIRWRVYRGRRILLFRSQRNT